MDYQNCTSSRDWRTLWSIKCKQEVGVQLLHCFICFRIITQCNVKINFHLAIVRSVNVWNKSLFSLMWLNNISGVILMKTKQYFFHLILLSFTVKIYHLHGQSTCLLLFDRDLFILIILSDVFVFVLVFSLVTNVHSFSKITAVWTAEILQQAKLFRKFDFCTFKPWQFKRRKLLAFKVSMKLKIRFSYFWTKLKLVI